MMRKLLCYIRRGESIFITISLTHPVSFFEFYFFKLSPKLVKDYY